VAIAAFVLSLLALAGVIALALRLRGDRSAELEERLEELETARAVETVERAAARRR
jgi:hypothetical protein